MLHAVCARASFSAENAFFRQCADPNDRIEIGAAIRLLAQRDCDCIEFALAGYFIGLVYKA